MTATLNAIELNLQNLGKELTERFIRSYLKKEGGAYKFTETPKVNIDNNYYNIYIHVPFCPSLCTFCPYYKVLYSKKLKDMYLETLIKEIQSKNIGDSPTWVNFGGGTPNILPIEDLNRILTELEHEVNFSNINVELLPSLITTDYLKGLKDFGVTRISVGVQSLQDSVTKETHRSSVSKSKVSEILRKAKELDFNVNVDMIAGLPGESRDEFIEDIRFLAGMEPSQFSIYHYIVPPGPENTKTAPSMDKITQYNLIEECGEILFSKGYERVDIRSFVRGDVYSPYSEDELSLMKSCVGFGPSATSNYKDYKVVNPELMSYIKDPNRAFVAPRTKAVDSVYQFWHMIYFLNCYTSNKYPTYINLFLRLLESLGYAENNKFNDKGIHIAYSIDSACDIKKADYERREELSPSFSLNSKKC